MSKIEMPKIFSREFGATPVAPIGAPYVTPNSQLFILFY